MLYNDSNKFVGGLVGYFDCYRESKIFNSYNTGNVKGGYLCSGFIGGSYIGNYFATLLINESFNSGNIEGTAFTSAFVSHWENNMNKSIIVKNCYNTGSVNGNYNGQIASLPITIIGSVNLGSKYPNEVLSETNIVYTFDTNGGSQIESITGGIIELPTPIKEGYLFYGWYENEDLSGEKINSEYYYSKENCTLYAKYLRILSNEELFNYLSSINNSPYATINENSLTIELPAESSRSRSASVNIINSTRAMVIKFNSNAAFEGSSYVNITYRRQYDNANYESVGLNVSQEYSIGLNPGDYIQVLAYQRSGAYVKVVVTDIVIAVEETE